MDEDNLLDNDSIEPNTRPRRANPYDALMRQSRKMGSAATKTLDVTKEFLKKDVTIIAPRSPDSLLFGLRDAVRGGQKTKNGVSAKEARAIRKIVKQSHEILAAAKTVPLPVNIFPDSITVDRTKVTIIKRTFFWTEQVITTRIEDILAVTSNCGPFFGSLIISTRVMNSTDHYEVNYFWRKDADFIKQIIQGYVIAQHNSIKTSHLEHDELVETLLELGRDSTL